VTYSLVHLILNIDKLDLCFPIRFFLVVNTDKDQSSHSVTGKKYSKKLCQY